MARLNVMSNALRIKLLLLLSLTLCSRSLAPFALFWSSAIFIFCLPNALRHMRHYGLHSHRAVSGNCQFFSQRFSCSWHCLGDKLASLPQPDAIFHTYVLPQPYCSAI